ncbi:ABC transporter permease [Heyndrickxia acidicola]|uniref:ABC transporter permease n=1 Tax=Heyndrickxia acidicola TaxID=209389 RepID=A0ABU6MD68_9BACI|nr:ABC transporter permease [Heyndrickxia acidicola]MED1202606.1 ABC transporter permease [Heyndrickxia acidicola]
MRKRKYSNTFITIIWFILLLIAWQAAVTFFHVEGWILPKPSDIVSSLMDNQVLLISNTIQTLEEVLIGLVVAVAVGMALATILDAVPFLKILVNPLLVVSQTIPIVAIAPLFIIWFGFGMLPKVLVVVLVCFFPISLSILEGFQTVDQAMLNLLKTMNATKWQVYRKVKFPAILPYFFSGLKIAVTYSVMGAIIGEWLGASDGLGVLLTRATKSFMTAQLFGVAAVIVIVTLIMYALVEALARMLAPWIYRKDDDRS